MAIVSVVKSFNGTSGNRSNDGKRRYSAEYLVKTDTIQDQTAVICDHFQNAGNLPRLGDPYRYANDYDPNAICTSIDPKRQANSATTWIVTLAYETPQGNKKDDDNNRQEKDPNGKLTSDPTFWRDQWDFRFHQLSIPAEKVIYRGGMKKSSALLMPEGKVTPAMNSAFKVFVPMPEKEVQIQVFRRETYRTKFNSGTSTTYQGKVNTNDINLTIAAYGLTIVASPYKLKVKDIGATLEFINDYSVWRYRYEFWVNPLGWRREFVDRGFEARAMAGDSDGRGGTISALDVPANTVPSRRLEDAQGNPLIEPVLLDGDGKPLITDQSYPEPVYITYSIDDEANIPNSLFMA